MFLINHRLPFQFVSYFSIAPKCETKFVECIKKNTSGIGQLIMCNKKHLLIDQLLIRWSRGIWAYEINFQASPNGFWNFAPDSWFNIVIKSTSMLPFFTSSSTVLRTQSTCYLNFYCHISLIIFNYKQVSRCDFLQRFFEEF